MGGAGLAVVVLASYLSGMLGPYPPALLVAGALLGVPGYLFSIALGIDREISAAERPAVYFTASIGLLVPAFLVPLVFATSLAWFVLGYGILVGLLACLALRARLATADESPDDRAASDLQCPVTRAALGAVVIALTAGAWKITATGSIDRWWYLAYIRSYMDAGALDLAEPFLAGDLVVPRFALHSWLLVMAAWARQAGVDPIWLYEAACPLVLVPVALSAALWLARSIFGRGQIVWLTVLATGLLWLGGLFPVVARLPEDKLLAALVLTPVAVGCFIRAARSGSFGQTAVFAACLAALATCHALAYAFLFVVLLPYSALALAGRRLKVLRVAPLVALLALGAAYPAYTGLASRDLLAHTGASMSRPDHPVVRVHQGRDRLLHLSTGDYVVNPNLLRPPLTVVALFSLPLVFFRRRAARDYLLPATLLPLAFTFVPPLAVAAGDWILPWMVYRLLWVIPFGALLGLAADTGSRRLPNHPWLVPIALVAIAVPPSADALAIRFEPWRQRLAVPGQGPVREAMRAVGTLDPDAAVAAAPEISERIPGMSGRHVLAAMDRTTIVFAASREAGEARLRARAAVMQGNWTPEADRPVPTHILFAPGEPAERHCGHTLFSTAGFELCEFSADGPGRGLPAPARAKAFAPASADGPFRLSLYDLIEHPAAEFSARCRPDVVMRPSHLVFSRTGPWSARALYVSCRVGLATPSGAPGGTPVSLTITPFLGRAVDELSISARGLRRRDVVWRRRTMRRARNDEPIRLALPGDPVDAIELTMAPSFLPFLKVRDVEISLDRVPATGRAPGASPEP